MNECMNDRQVDEGGGSRVPSVRAGQGQDLSLGLGLLVSRAFMNLSVNSSGSSGS